MFSIASFGFLFEGKLCFLYYKYSMNFVIVHFNTPEVTTCLIRSIFKFHTDAKIIVFDNSEKRPFEKIICDTYYDNTKNQIIDFQK